MRDYLKDRLRVGEAQEVGKPGPFTRIFSPSLAGTSSALNKVQVISIFPMIHIHFSQARKICFKSANYLMSELSKHSADNEVIRIWAIILDAFSSDCGSTRRNECHLQLRFIFFWKTEEPGQEGEAGWGRKESECPACVSWSGTVMRQKRSPKWLGNLRVRWRCI